MARGNARASSEQPARRSLADRIGGFQAPDEGATAPLGFIPKMETKSKDDALAQGMVGTSIWGQDKIREEIFDHITDLADAANKGDLAGYEFLKDIDYADKTMASQAVVEDPEYAGAMMAAQEFEYKVDLVKDALKDKKFDWKDEASVQEILPLRMDERDEGADMSDAKSFKAFAKARLKEADEIADEYRDEINTHQARVIEEYGRSRGA
jgi:hypothetical protein